MRFVVAAFVLAASPVASASEWIVDAAGGGDFTDLPAAVAASQPGDVLLVRPGAYSGFVLGKRLVIRATAPGVEVSPRIDVVGVPAGSEGAALSGLTIRPTETLDSLALVISDCAGDFVGEEITVVYDQAFGDAEFVSIRDCASVALDGLVTPKDVQYSEYLEWKAPAGLLVERSKVRLADVDVHGIDGLQTDSATFWFEGGSGIEAIDSYLVLARPQVIGGRGSPARYDCMHHDPGMRGGAGLSVTDCDVVVLGTEGDLIQGGEGGSAKWIPFCPQPAIGGNGGPGLWSASSTVLVSRVERAGGAGGKSEQGFDGTDGPSDAGDPPTQLDLLPHLVVTADLTPGGAASVTVDAVELGSVLLIVSDLGGFVRASPRDVGPLLSALPSGAFQVVSMGRTDGAGDATLQQQLPDDPALTGLVVELQAAELADSGTVYFGNAVVRVIGL